MIDVVIPTIGRPSLGRLLESLAAATGPLPARIIIVDDRPDRSAPLAGIFATPLSDRITVVPGAARGPAAARNRGVRASQAHWIAFLDDDVIVGLTWLTDLAADIDACPPDAAASTGRVVVPLPTERRSTDWERNVAGLETARWITADCAYRRSDFVRAGGFDERFPRAFREDADLALRVIGDGRQIVAGRRCVTHPVRAASTFVSVTAQAGNADDVLMEALHGRDWYERAGAPRGAFLSHVWTVAWALAAATCALVWLGSTLRFAWRRIALGPRSRGEVGAMILTSAVLPFAAVAHRLAGYIALPVQLAAGRPACVPCAVLFDRDGTLVEDVPYNGEPAAVRPVTGAFAALARLRRAGISIGIVTNQSGIALGKVSPAQVAAVHSRVAELLGPIDTIAVCPHATTDGCACRKPQPGLIIDAARALGVDARDCVVVGDIGSDIEAARAAGAVGILVPTAATRPAEIAAAKIVARSLTEAVDLILATS